jgi:hypothetical protein
MSLKEVLKDESFVSGDEIVPLTIAGKQVEFKVRKLGWLEMQAVWSRAASQDQNPLALLVKAAVSVEGATFTYEEISQLKEEYAQPLFEAVAKLNDVPNTEKK